MSEAAHREHRLVCPASISGSEHVRDFAPRKLACLLLFLGLSLLGDHAVLTIQKQELGLFCMSIMAAIAAQRWSPHTIS